MTENQYWPNQPGRRLNRRTLLAAGAGGVAALSGAAALACGGPKKTGQAAAPAAGTGGQPARETPRAGGTLTDYLPESYGLDPHKLLLGGLQLTGAAMSRVFRYTTSTDPQTITDHTLEQDLGVSAESADAVTWTVRLRPNAKFQNIPPVNGHAVEAEDVKATFIRALNPATGNPNRGALGMLDPNQIQTPDKQTVVFKLNYPYAPFRNLLGSPAYSWILPREALAGDYEPSKTVIGSGPFILESAQPDVAYTYKRNPDWFDKPGPYLDELRIAVIPSGAQQLAQFTAGNLDHLEFRLPFDLATAKQSAPRAAVTRVASGPANPLFFQLGDPTSVFQDIRVRRALSMAIDRDALGKSVYGGEAVQYVFVPGFLGKWSLPVDKLNPAIRQYYQYNPAEAKKLLEAAGQTNLQIRLTNPLASMGQIDLTKSVEAINGMLNAIGVRSTILNLDFNKDFIGSGHGIRAGYYDKDMVICTANSPYTEADDVLFGFLHSRNNQNIEHLNDPAYDAMVDKQRTIVNEDERVKAVQDIQKYVAENMYAVSTVGSYRWELVQPRVRNYSYSDSYGFYTENYAKAWLTG
jgi:peptide/nickel transport system substrate-binding protein